MKLALFLLATTLAAQSVSFLRSDTATQGNWRGKFGAAGYSVAGESPQLPVWATVAIRDNWFYTWAATTADVRAPLKTNSRSRWVQCGGAHPGYRSTPRT